MKIDSFFLTYEDALELVSNYLNEIKNIKKFCIENSFDYYNVLKIKSLKQEPKFPQLVKKLLFKMGYDVDIETCYIIKKKDLLSR